ncbi:hypothetical protein FRC08_016993 [Ceratobasidium sp. 394]|nr:hypothetical protein FRC08_016993 [Ceratobasidium sp. 394]
MNASWWPRRASASDTPNPPRTTIRAARSFDPSPSGSSSGPTRSRTTSNTGPESGRKLTVLVNALGIGSSSLSKSKSRERLRSSGTSSTPESSRPSPTPPSLIQTASFFASGAGAAPIAASSIAAPSRRVAKSSVGSSSRIPRSSPNRQTVVSTESGSSWGATTSSADPPDQFSIWEPTTPSSASDTKQSFQSLGMVVGEDPFARAPATVWVAKGKAPEVEGPRKKDKEKERVRKLAVSAGSGPGGRLDDGSVSPLSLSPMSAFPPPPDSTGFGPPRRSASALASGPSIAGPFATDSNIAVVSRCATDSVSPSYTDIPIFSATHPGIWISWPKTESSFSARGLGLADIRATDAHARVGPGRFRIGDGCLGVPYGR